MNKILIDMVTGTVLNYDDKVVIVDVDRLDETGNALMEEWNVGGNDSTIIEVGEKYGTSVMSFLNDLRYGNCIAYSPNAIRDEAQEMLDNDAYAKDVLEWVVNDATDDQLNAVAGFILDSDTAWVDYVPNIIEGIDWAYEQHKKGTL